MNDRLLWAIDRSGMIWDDEKRFTNYSLAEHIWSHFKDPAYPEDRIIEGLLGIDDIEKFCRGLVSTIEVSEALDHLLEMASDPTEIRVIMARAIVDEDGFFHLTADEEALINT